MQQVLVAQIAVAGDGGDVGYGGVKITGVLVVFVVFEVPQRQPGGDVILELWDERVEVGGGGVLADDVEDGEEDVVAGYRGWWEDVEDGGEGCDGEGGGVLCRGCDGLLEILAYSGEELVLVGGLCREGNEEVVGSGEF